jgi:hypothetical protein
MHCGVLEHLNWDLAPALCSTIGAESRQMLFLAMTYSKSKAKVIEIRLI